MDDDGDLIFLAEGDEEVSEVEDALVVLEAYFVNHGGVRLALEVVRNAFER